MRAVCCCSCCACRVSQTETGDLLIKVLIGLVTCTVHHCPGHCAPECVCEDVRACLLSVCTAKMWCLKKWKDIVRSQKRRGGDGDGIWGEPWFSQGRRGNQKPPCVLMRCYFISDWYKALSNWSALWERWLPGTAVTGSDVCWCAPASSMTFLKMKARATESCHVEQRQRWRQGYRNQVTNLIPLVTIYFPWQTGSLLKEATEEYSHSSQAQ